jgi:hypothetical protein
MEAEIVKMQATIDGLMVKYKDVVSRIEEMENAKNTATMEGKVNSLWEQFESLTNLLNVVRNDIRAFYLDDKFFELFSDEEMMKLYSMSKVKASQLVEFLSSALKVVVEEGEAVKMACGGARSVRERSIIGRWLKKEVLKLNQ